MFDGIVDLNAALNAFDQTEANIVRLESICDEVRALIPDDIAFIGGANAEGLRYRELIRSYRAIVKALPTIDGWRPSADLPDDLDAIAQARLEYSEDDMFGGSASLERMQFDRTLQAPFVEIAEYRHRINGKRRKVVRARLQELIGEIDALLATLVAKVERTREVVDEPELDQLEESFAEVHRLVGNTVTKAGRWNDMARHLHFHQGQDIHDIEGMDWPTVREDIVSSMYDRYEPVPVSVEDIGTLVAEEPKGPVTTALSWNNLDDEQFERLIYNILKDSAGYENVRLLTKTHATDRGRDLQAERVRKDPLLGTQRERVVIQCKHWPSRSVSATDLGNAATQTRLWEPPPVDALVVATSGHFSTDAVQWAEGRKENRERPVVELLSRVDLESFLAQRPHLVIEFRLR